LFSEREEATNPTEGAKRMDYPINGGPGESGRGSAGTMDANDVAAGVREYAQDAAENLNEMVTRGKELVVRYPILSVAGAVAAGWLFARFVAKRR
jgi:hypothetical protein